MGWSIYLISDREINEKDIDEIVKELPNKYSYTKDTNSNNKQQWGWITAVDVSIRDKNTVLLGGSYSQSGVIAEEFAVYFREQLEGLNYKIETKFGW